MSMGQLVTESVEKLERFYSYGNVISEVYQGSWGLHYGLHTTFEVWRINERRIGAVALLERFFNRFGSV